MTTPAAYTPANPVEHGLDQATTSQAPANDAARLTWFDSALRFFHELDAVLTDASELARRHSIYKSR